MAVMHKRGTRAAVAVCFGALALPASASAMHRSDMPWCPHSTVQGADPADQVPGAAGSGTMRSGSEAPLGAPAASGAPAAPAPASNAGARPGQASTTRQATTVQQAAVVQQGSVARQAVAASGGVVQQVTAAGTTPVRLADGRTVEIRGPVTVAAARKARAAARAQERREARGLAKARAEARAERARVARGARAVAEVRLTSPEWWLARSVSGSSEGTSLPAIGGIVAALLAMAGLAVAVVGRRRRGGSPRATAADPPSIGPTPERAAAIEAALQEIIAEEHASRLADERSAALRE